MDWKEFWKGEVIKVTPLFDKDEACAKAMSEMLTFAVNNPDTMPTEARELLMRETNRVLVQERGRIAKLLWGATCKGNGGE